jgi:hypothetical protein
MSESKATTIEAISDVDAARLKSEQATRAAKVWNFQAFTDPYSALTFINRPPAQGPGEVSFVVMPNGLIGAFYYL